MDEWAALRARLADVGVAGTEDLGRFVSNPEFFGSSAFDERAAMSVLIEALPDLTDANLVGAVAGHLRRPWARPAAFDALRAAFAVWAPRDGSTGWHVGDSLGSAATKAHVSELLVLCSDDRYGTARQMVVNSLGRFKREPGIEPMLLRLIDNADVALHAMSALRRVLGSQAALPHLERVARENQGTKVGDQAQAQVKKAKKSSA